MIVYAIVIAVIVAVIDYFIGIKEPWRKLIYVGLIILFVVGLILLLVPGLFPIRGI